MASSRGQNDPQSQRNEELNPFVAFRRFADEQIASLWHNVLGLPIPSQSSAALRSRCYNDDSEKESAEIQARGEHDPQWAKEANRRLEDTLVKVWNKRAESPLDFIDESSGDFHQSTETGITNGPSELEQLRDFIGSARRMFTRLQESQASSGVEDTRSTLNGFGDGDLKCPYRPADQTSPEGSPVSGYFSESPANDTDSSPTCIGPFALQNLMRRHPFAYLLWSSYSPLHLEQEPTLRGSHVEWRRAFEDLTGTQIGGEWSDLDDFERDPFGNRLNATKPLQLHDSFPGPLVPSLWDIIAAAVANNEAGSEQCSELDLYENFLGFQYPQATSSRPSFSSMNNANFAPPSTAVASASVDPPTVTSTLTTTERSTLADGSIHTKVVLKKRFADGREESTETVHTTYGSQAEGHDSAKPSVAGEAQDLPSQKSESIAEQARKKGWFWS